MVDITFSMDRAFGVKNVKTIAPLAANSVSGTASDAGKRYIIYNPWTQGEPVRESAKNSNSKTQTREMEAGSSEGRRSIKPLLEGTVNSSVERLSLSSVGKEGEPLLTRGCQPAYTGGSCCTAFRNTILTH